jgi:phage terminase large subunit-like protein
MMNEWDEKKALKKGYTDRLTSVDLDRYNLRKIDGRLFSYIYGVQSCPEGHNLYEVLSVLKFLRLMDTYTFQKKRVKVFVALYESLKFSGINGRRSYKLTPVQYFQFASILGFYRWEDIGSVEDMTERKKGTKVVNGRVMELRRLVREAILFVPRKFSKTTSTASLAVNDLLFGDANAQAYTGANSGRQAKICFNEIKGIINQLDPDRRSFKTNREWLGWRPTNTYGKESFVECLSGGGDAKDGLNASLFIFDEYAQARYVKDHSEGAELMQVMVSSMGMRREPLTVIITTASRVPDGPFAIELENAKKVLLGEYDDDTQFASLFMPDEWELDDEHMSTPELWKKCNPHIGITVQEGYYRQMWNKAIRNVEAMIEFKTKLLNVFVAGSVKPWITQNFAHSLP